MSPDGSTTQNGSLWHPMKTWIPMLSLSVREITSVSATFILSAKLDESDPSLASLGLEAAAIDDNLEDGGPEQTGSDGRIFDELHGKKHRSVVADVLAKGLSVNVNGAAWPRAVIRIDDQLDEAVIIIFALMPGRQYDIELGLPHRSHFNSGLRRQVTTEDTDSTEIASDPESPSVDTHSASASSSSEPHSTPSTSPSGTAPGTPPSSTASIPQITLEDRLNQLQHNLSLIDNERETILASLKSARRDAQKGEAALRAEIETLKRTSEKNSAAELRGKQKVLALQESVKRAQNSAAETDDITRELESELPDLLKQKEDKERRHERIESEASKVRKQREEVEEMERKRLDGMKTELTSLTNKLDRLTSKRDKLEGTTIPDLESKLDEIEQEIQDAEDQLAVLEKEQRTRIQLEETYLSHQRVRHNSAGPIGRPPHALTPIHRPTEANLNPLWPSISTQRLAQTPSHQTHNPRSQSLHAHNHIQHTSTPVLLLNPRRQANPPGILPNLTLQSKSSTPHTDPSSSSATPPSPTRTSPNSIAAASTLSSLAPAFEPSRPLVSKLANGVNAGPHQRPHVGNSIPTAAPPPPVGAGRPSRASTGSHVHGPAHGNGQRGPHH